jgi:hypothetical protein
MDIFISPGISSSTAALRMCNVGECSACDGSTMDSHSESCGMGCSYWTSMAGRRVKYRGMAHELYVCVFNPQSCVVLFYLIGIRLFAMRFISSILALVLFDGRTVAGGKTMQERQQELKAQREKEAAARIAIKAHLAEQALKEKQSELDENAQRIVLELARKLQESEIQLKRAQEMTEKNRDESHENKRREIDLRKQRLARQRAIEAGEEVPFDSMRELMEQADSYAVHSQDLSSALADLMMQEASLELRIKALRDSLGKELSLRDAYVASLARERRIRQERADVEAVSSHADDTEAHENLRAMFDKAQAEADEHQAREQALVNAAGIFNDASRELCDAWISQKLNKVLNIVSSIDEVYSSADPLCSDQITAAIPANWQSNRKHAAQAIRISIQTGADATNALERIESEAGSDVKLLADIEVAKWAYRRLILQPQRTAPFGSKARSELETYYRERLDAIYTLATVLADLEGGDSKNIKEAAVALGSEATREKFIHDYSVTDDNHEAYKQKALDRIGRWLPEMAARAFKWPEVRQQLRHAVLDRINHATEPIPQSFTALTKSVTGEYDALASGDLSEVGHIANAMIEQAGH